MRNPPAEEEMETEAQLNLHCEPGKSPLAVFLSYSTDTLNASPPERQWQYCGVPGSTGGISTPSGSRVKWSSGLALVSAPEAVVVFH